MKILEQLQVNDEVTRPAQGQFIYVRDADGSIEVVTNSGVAYDLERWEQVRVPDGADFSSISIRNKHDGANNIQLEIGYGRFYPPSEGNSTRAVVTDMPAMTVAAEQSIDVGNFPSSFGVSSLPSVSVNNFPQSFQVSSLPAVSIDNFPQSFQVSSLPLVELQKPQGYNPLAPADFSGGDVVIAAKSGRDTLVIMTPETNKGRIWVGGANIGIPLMPGQPFNLASGAAITLHAEQSTDTCYLAEVLN